MACECGIMVRIKDLFTGIHSLSLYLISGISFLQTSDISYIINNLKGLKLTVVVSLQKYLKSNPETAFFPSQNAFNRLHSIEYAYILPLRKKLH